MFGANDNTVKNLAALAAEQSLVAEQRLLELYDIAAAAGELSREYAADGLSAYEILSAITPEDEPSSVLQSDGTPDLLRAPLGRYVGVTSSLDRAVFCELFTREASRLGLPLTERDLLHTGAGDETFIYTRNSFADEAYDVLSQDFASPRVRYGTSFADCVRAVNAGECRFLLLPLEEKGGSRLPTVAELIYRSDLKINAVTPVFGYDGMADLKYALLSRDFLLPDCTSGDDRYLEVRVSATDASVAELFSVVRYLGLSLYRVDTQSFDTEGERDTYLSLVLRDGGDGFAALLIYLALFATDYTPVGLYKNLE